MDEFSVQGINLQGRKITVLGLAREGSAVSRFCAEHGALVTATDLKGPDELGPVLRELEGLPVRYLLGGHPLEVSDCDMMFVSPGVPLDSPILIQARQMRLPLGSEARLFSRLCPAPVAGITGSSGKTTTSTLTARILEAAGMQVHLGGNIGYPLLSRLSSIRPSDAVVMELSSFQLDFFADELDAEPAGSLASPLYPPGGWSPHVAAVLNVTPNHLDRHPTMESYIAAKRKILLYQRPDDVAVLGWDDPVTKGFRRHCSGSVAFFSVHERVPQGAYLRGDTLVLAQQGREVDICNRRDLLLRGTHNVCNVLAACAVAAVMGVQADLMAKVARTFAGVEHRLELVGEIDGVRYFNDSIATSPERAIAALASFDEPVLLLAGGRDKHLPWETWAHLVQRKATMVITFGEAATLVEHALRQLEGATPPVRSAGSLERAVELAHDAARPGQVVLFSPGGTSFDAYRDYVDRGEAFKTMVGRLRDAHEHSPDEGRNDR